MTPLNMTQIAVAAVLATSCGAAADQFAIRTAAPVKAASPQLLDALHIREIETVTINGAHFIVLEAKNEGYAEAYIFANGIVAEALYRIGADWTGTGMSALPIEQREGFFAPTLCEFCTG
ncbi:hypothetical protein [Sulfitobacter sp. PS-8MA]|uniref:hypothetical protein n=1 Tax=Sulfitobacter sp. PS-8MA TaxID=3237707 RepID=UPI0034C6DEAC